MSQLLWPLNKYLFALNRSLKPDLSKDYYKVLGLSRSSSKTDIRDSYLKSVRHHHPDSQLNNESQSPVDCNEQLSSIVEAYRILSNESLRKQYDEGRQLDLLSRNRLKRRLNYNKGMYQDFDTPHQNQVRCQFSEIYPQDTNGSRYPRQWSTAKEKEEQLSNLRKSWKLNYEQDMKQVLKFEEKLRRIEKQAYNQRNPQSINYWEKVQQIIRKSNLLNLIKSLSDKLKQKSQDCEQKQGFWNRVKKQFDSRKQ